MYGITKIQSLCYDSEDEKFYVLANKKDETIGFYLIQFSKDDPNDFYFLNMVRHNLDIDNVNMSVCRGHSCNHSFKELIVSYKTIYINTFTVVTIDISDMSKENHTAQILNKHESF